MNRRPLPFQSNRVLFIAAHIAIAWLFYWVIVQSAMSVLSNQVDQINDRRLELSRYAKLAGQAANAEKLRDQMRKDANSSLFLKGADEGAASAFLQGQVREIASQSGLKIRSIASTGRHDADGINYMAVRVDSVGTIGSVYDAVSAIQNNAAPMLFVDNLEIHAPASVDSAPL